MPIMQTDMKVYVAGPMTGIPQFNFPAFDEAARRLREWGHEAITPSELDSPETRAEALASPDGAMIDGRLNDQTWGDLLSRDVKIVADEVDVIAMLPGWWNSRGACLELYVALLTGKKLWKILEGTDGEATASFVPLSKEEARRGVATPIHWPVGEHDGHSVRTLA